MSDKPRILAARHIQIMKGEVHPETKIYYWKIAPDMQDMAFEKGDVVRVFAGGGKAPVLVEDVLSEVPDGAPEPKKETVSMVQVTPDMDWPRKRKKEKLVVEPDNPEEEDLRKFRSRLQFALESRMLEYAELAAMMGTTEEYIENCANGSQIPARLKLRRMAHKLEVRPKWLAGEPDGPLSFGDRVRQTLKEKEIGISSLEYGVGMPYPELFLYITGERVPTIDILLKVAQTLNVSAPWLAGNR